jgi:Arc/MetJ family transcription regulator
MGMVTVTIEIDSDAVRMIMERYGVSTTTAAVDLALRSLAGQPVSRAEALAMRGAHAIVETPGDAAPPAA